MKSQQVWARKGEATVRSTRLASRAARQLTNASHGRDVPVPKRAAATLGQRARLRHQRMGGHVLDATGVGVERPVITAQEGLGGEGPRHPGGLVPVRRGGAARRCLRSSPGSRPPGRREEVGHAGL